MWSFPTGSLRPITRHSIATAGKIRIAGDLTAKKSFKSQNSIIAITGNIAMQSERKMAINTITSPPFILKSNSVSIYLCKNKNQAPIKRAFILVFKGLRPYVDLMIQCPRPLPYIGLGAKRIP